MPLVLLDTNILIYAIDQNDPVKQAQAIDLLERLAASRSGVLSVQSLAEFTNACLRRLRPPLSAAAAAEQVERLARSYPILNLTAPIVIEAVRGVRDFKLSYYDAQIWATARLNQIPVVFSDDFASGTSRESVYFVNPFAEDFDLNTWA